MGAVTVTDMALPLLELFPTYFTFGRVTQVGHKCLLPVSLGSPESHVTPARGQAQHFLRTAQEGRDEGPRLSPRQALSIRERGPSSPAASGRAKTDPPCTKCPGWAEQQARSWSPEGPEHRARRGRRDP